MWIQKPDLCRIKMKDQERFLTKFWIERKFRQQLTSSFHPTKVSRTDTFPGKSLFQELKLGFWCSFTIYSKFLSCMRSPEFRTIAPNCLVLTLSIFLITPPISPPLCFIVFGAMIRFFYASSYFNFYNEIAPPPHIIIPLISQVTPIKNMRNKWVVSCRYRYDNDAVLIEIGRSELIIGMGNK